MVLKMGFRLPYLQIIRWLYVQTRFILTHFAKHVAIHEKAHLCEVIFWNSPCVSAMRCGKNQTLFDFIAARQITRTGFACMEMIQRFKEGWIIWHPRGLSLTNENRPKSEKKFIIINRALFYNMLRPDFFYYMFYGPVYINFFNQNKKNWKL